ncbi:PucR family transcriptional regulator [Actinomycetospora sp. CA-084318]|uniref:PucR family transcriptional regulator n=1 Tax=Actinomycetospora sp. CA-084318 TaxID=3239892 RepID=UPI003D99A37E
MTSSVDSAVAGAVDDVDDLPRRLAGLTEGALSGMDVGRLVERVAGLLGLPVALREPDLGVRCWSAPAVFGLARPPVLPAAAWSCAAVAPLVAGLGPRQPSTVLPPVPVHGLVRRHLLAVLVVDGEPAGYLDVGELGRRLRPADAVLVEQAAGMVSLRLAGDVRVERVLARTREDVLADLLRGTRPLDDLRRLAARSGLDLEPAHVLVRFPTRPGTAPVDARGPVAAALEHVVATHLEPDAVVGLVALPGDPAARARALRVHLHGELDRVEAATGIRRIVVSGVVGDPEGLPGALAGTREVDEIVRAFGGAAEVVAVDEFDTVRLVVSADKAGAAVRFAEQNLGPLRRSDESSGGDLVATLRAYLAAGAQVRAAAGALGVHENTVRYRLGRIQHLTGLDLRRFDALLVAQLAFQIEGLAGGEGVGPGAPRQDRMGTADGDRTKGNV